MVLIAFEQTKLIHNYKTIIGLLPVVLYDCETSSLTLREEHRLRVFENKVLRKIFGAKRDEITGQWRKLHNAKLHAFYSSPNRPRWSHGYHTRHWIRGSRVQTQPVSMDFFRA